MSSLSAKAAVVAEKTQPYWFKQPVALFAPGGSWKNYFPSFRAPLLGPRNVNAITRITLLIIIIVAIAMRSWWPVAIGAGVLLLIVLLAYGWDVYQRKRLGQALATDVVVQAATTSSSTDASTNSQTAVLADDDDDDASLNIGNANTADDEHSVFDYSLAPSPLFVDENGFAVDERDEIAGMRNLLENFEPPETASFSSATGQGELKQHSRSFDSKPPITFGVDPKTVQATMLSEDMPARYRKSAFRRDTDAIDAIYGPSGKADNNNGDKRKQQHPLTQTEQMIEKMHKDVDEYFWDEMVAKRAPRWQQDPNDPRTRRKAEQDELERGSWRGFHWSNGP